MLLLIIESRSNIKSKNVFSPTKYFTIFQPGV